MSLLSGMSPGVPGKQLSIPPVAVIFGQSSAMHAVRRKVEKLANTDVPILIQGESGTGKEIIARLIHQNSSWSGGPFVKVNCPAIPGTLVESELFGYEKGAFTGAYDTKPGRVETARMGTLFLDEIGEMDMGLQSKLLQILQDGQFCRIGAQEDKTLGARVVCATNRALEEEVEAGTFRQDLFYRISVIGIGVPPLRERPEDVPGLVDYFLEHYSALYASAVSPLSLDVMRTLQGFRWPGNVRQLENVVKRYVILGSLDVLFEGLETKTEDPQHLDLDFGANGTIALKQVTREAVRKIERNIILKVLHRHQWNRKQAARTLNISYRALLYKLKETGIQLDGSEAIVRTGVRFGTQLPAFATEVDHEM